MARWCGLRQHLPVPLWAIEAGAAVARWRSFSSDRATAVCAAPPLYSRRRGSWNDIITAENTMPSPRTRRVRVRKELVSHEVGGPESEPLFVNHFQVSFHDDDWYLDAGLLPIDDLLAKKAEVRFLVLQRLAMTARSLRKLREQIDEVLGKADSAGASDAKNQAKPSTNKSKTRASKGTNRAS